MAKLALDWIGQCTNHLVTDEHIHKRKGASTTLPILKKSEFQLHIAVPPLAEQRRIAAILEQADNLRRLRGAAADRLSRLGQSLFWEMFGERLRSIENLDTTISDACLKITDGTHHSPRIVASGVPYVTAKHLRPDGLNFYSDPWYISEEDHRSIFSRCDPEKGDVLYIKDGATTGVNALVTKAKIVKDLGNIFAVHETRSVPPERAVTAVRELFHFSYWFVRTYARGAKPAAGIVFSPEALPATAQVESTTLAKLRSMAAAFAETEKARDRAEKEKLKSEGDRLKLEAEIKGLRAEIPKVKKANQAIPDDHDYDEAQTRDAFIDLLLAEAGWPLSQTRDTEFPVTGMPNESGDGFVDYVLWGDDGKPLGLIEAKRTKHDARVGQRQAELYADALERQFGQRPVIFYSNGYEHWIWDDQRYPPRAIQGFLKEDELTDLVTEGNYRYDCPFAISLWPPVAGVYRAESFERRCRVSRESFAVDDFVAANSP